MGLWKRHLGVFERAEVARWLEQDMPKWDVGGFVVGDAPHYAMLQAARYEKCALLLID